jgi:predicted Zn finger-like uncharacterized protein
VIAERGIAKLGGDLQDAPPKDCRMKIVCPACDAAYDVPPSVVSSQRKMRCARCAQDWVPREAAAEGVASPAPAPEPAEAAAAPHTAMPEPGPARSDAAEPEPDAGTGPEPMPAVILPPPPSAVPPVDELAFTPASFTRFDALPPVIDPLEATGFEPLVLKPSQLMASPVAPLLHAVPPRQPGETDASLIVPPAAGAGGPSLGAIVAAWAASFALVLGLGWAGVHWREGIMKAWPPSEHLYIALGMSDPPSGIPSTSPSGS